MKKIFTLISIAAVTILTACGSNKSEVEETEKEKQVVTDTVVESKNTSNEEKAKIEEMQTINSVEFLKNLSSDNFFVKDNINKTFFITDLLVTEYQLDNDGNSAKLLAYSYDPKIKKHLRASLYGNVEFIPILNGKEISTIKNSDITNDEYHQYIIYLKDPKQLKLLKMYNPKRISVETLKDSKRWTNEISSHDTGYAHYEIRDLINIKGVFTKKEGLSRVVLSGVEIKSNEQ